MTKDKLLQQDEYGRWNGIALVNKPTGKTSHDLVYELRRKFETRKVGHAGALDPFAEGLMIYLIGKSTKKSDEFLHADKSYEMTVLFGISTNSGDPEGEITSLENPREILTKEKIFKGLAPFLPDYEQYVPVFSSVKVNGEKLRKLARKYERFEIEDKNDSKVVKFFQAEDIKKEVVLPRKNVKLWDVNIIEISEVPSAEVVKMMNGLSERNKKAILKQEKYQIAKISISCSKGTYIRQLSVDLGENLDISSMLIALKRTRIGLYDLNMVNVNL